jgi:N-acetylglutamate synthase-like GNAT family acetyltransferase
VIVRAARAEDAPAIYALIEANRERGRLLPRTMEDISRRIATTATFYVAEHGEGSSLPRAGRLSPIAGCAEVVRLSATVAEVRSLVVDEPLRGNGVAGKLVAALTKRAQLDGHHRLCAFAHDPVPFIRLGFSIVPHAWVPEKISRDCAGCPLFRQCGQYALMISIQPLRRSVWQRRSDAA